jgi:hypothetical protein
VFGLVRGGVRDRSRRCSGWLAVVAWSWLGVGLGRPVERHRYVEAPRDDVGGEAGVDLIRAGALVGVGVRVRARLGLGLG